MNDAFIADDSVILGENREQNPDENPLNMGFVMHPDDSDTSMEADLVEHLPHIIKSQRKLPNIQIWDDSSEEYKTYQVSRVAMSSINECKVYIR